MVKNSGEGINNETIGHFPIYKKRALKLIEGNNKMLPGKSMLSIYIIYCSFLTWILHINCSLFIFNECSVWCEGKRYAYTSVLDARGQFNRDNGIIFLWFGLGHALYISDGERERLYVGVQLKPGCTVSNILRTIPYVPCQAKCYY